MVGAVEGQVRELGERMSNINVECLRREQNTVMLGDERLPPVSRNVDQGYLQALIREFHGGRKEKLL